MPEFNAAIFDLDGVIVSTDKYHRLGWQRLADELGIPFTPEQAERTRGVDRMASLRVVLGADHRYSEAEMEELAARKNRYYVESIRQVSPADLLPGTLELLDELAAQGVRMAVGSASKNATAVLERLGIGRRFATIVTGDDFTRGKPAPDVFLTAAQRLGVPPENCIVFEDAAAGIQAAHAGGMKAVGVGRGDAVAGAELIVRSLAEVRYDALAKLLMDDTWLITESPCPFSRRRGMEAIHTLGNGYLGCRGFFEEEQEGVEALGGIYMAGVFGEGALKAWKGMHRELVNTPNFLWTRITVDGEPVLARPGRIRDHVRTLDMRHGTLTRAFVWTSADGVRVAFTFERFMSVADLHLAGQRIEITPLNGAPRIDVRCGINANVKQLNMVTCSPLPIQPGRPHLKTLRAGADVIEAQVATLPNGVRIVEGQQVVVEGPKGQIQGASAAAPGLAARRFVFTGKPGVMVRVTKIAHIFTSRDGNAAALLRKRLARSPDYDALRDAHRAEWARKWHDADIEVDGSKDDQRALRFNLFQLMQACPEHDPRVSLGARGLSGEMHEGSVFWDNEIFKLPFFTFVNPPATRNMLRFRHHTLPEARRHAKDLWFDGAMYAWKSGDDGVEETEMGVGAYYAIHIVADIAYALRQYWEATGDDAFLARYGVEIFIETARFWRSRAHYDAIRKTWNLLAVRGPNEYDVIVNNNGFTNTMAAENLRYAAEAVAFLKRTQPVAWAKLAARLAFDAKERAAWKKLARGLVIPYDRKEDLYAEDDMYLHRVPFDMKRGKPDARRVIDSTLPYEAMAYFQITKQSDVISMMNLLPWKFSPEQMRVAYRFYEPRTVHDSSLSYAPHAVMAARLGMMQDAYRYFRECAFLDLADVQLNTISGLHFANLGGTWQAVILGFAGLWQHGNVLHLGPHLPEAWKALRFRVRFKGATLRVEMKGRRTSVTLEKTGQAPVALQIGRASARLKTAGETVTR